MGSSDEDNEPAAKRPRHVPTASEDDREEQPHQRIEIFERLTAFPVIQQVFMLAVSAYTRAKFSSPSVTQNLLTSAESIIAYGTSVALSAAGAVPIVLAADSLACRAIDWTFREHSLRTSRTAERIVQAARYSFNIVMAAFFAALQVFADFSLEGTNIIVRFVLILMDTIFSAISSSIDLIFPDGADAPNQGNGLTSPWVTEFIDNIVTSFSQIPLRIFNVLINSLSERPFEAFPGSQPENPSDAEATGDFGKADVEQRHRNLNGKKYHEKGPEKK